MQKKIEPVEALKMLLSLPATTQVEGIPLEESMGRVLAEDIYTTLPIPPYDRSPYDGYAFRSADTAEATSATPAVLRIIQEIQAGQMPEMDVTQGTASKILTGGLVPQGADAIQKFELTEYNRNIVKIATPVPAGSNVIRAGEDQPAGSLTAAAGTLVNGSQLGVIASQGIASVRVFQKPVISIVSTGSELLDPGQTWQDAKIYNSNFYTLYGYLAAQGAAARNCGVVADDPEKIALRVEEALPQSDMVVTTGGVSVGDYDYTMEAVRRLGSELLFWKISMKPGGTMLASVKDGKLILSLSGNPGAAILGLLRVALPYIRKLCGRNDLYLEEVRVRLRQPLEKASPVMRLLRGHLMIEDGTAWFSYHESQRGGDLSSLRGCDLIGEIEAGSPPLPAGAYIRAYRL